MIASYNCDNSMLSCSNYVNKFIQTNKPLIIAIQDRPNKFNVNILQDDNYGFIDDNESKQMFIIDLIRIKSVNILTKDDQDYINLIRDNNKQLTTFGIEFIEHAFEERKTIIFSIYIKPRVEYDKLRLFFNYIKLKCNNKFSNVIIVGDTNSHHTEWIPTKELISTTIRNNNYKAQNNSLLHYDNIKINTGNFIYDWTRKNRLTILNNSQEGPTFIDDNHHHNHSYIDLIIVGEKCKRKWKYFYVYKQNEPDNRKSHRIVFTTIHSFTTTTINKNNNINDRLNTRYKYDVNLIKPEMFKSLKEKHMTMNNIDIWKRYKNENIELKMNELTDKLYYQILYIQENLIKKKIVQLKPDYKIMNKTRLMKFKSKYNNLIKDYWRLKRERKQLKGDYNRIEKNELSKTINKNKLKLDNLRKKIIEGFIKQHEVDQVNHVSEVNNVSEDDEVTEVNEVDEATDANQIIQVSNRLLKENVNIDDITLFENSEQMWATINKYKNRSTLIVKDNNLIKDQNHINQLAKEKFPQLDSDSRNEILNIHKSISPIDRIIDDKEILRAIEEVKNKKYTGPEGLRFSIFNECIKYIPEIIITIAKMSYYIGIIPKVCQLTLGHLIPKPKNPQQFRIVHISTPLAALLEIIALHHLEYHLLNENKKHHDNLLFDVRQFAFTAKKSRHDLIARLLENVLKNKTNPHLKEQARTVIVGLDIKGAFDNIDQNYLIKKLNNDLPDSNIVKWITSFILQRKITIKYNNLCSTTPIPVHTGVPQGSSIGPILFNYSINQINRENYFVKNERNKFEILAYADDLIFIYHGTNNKIRLEGQQALDYISYSLEKINLYIEPNKCQYMIIKNTTGKNEKYNVKDTGYTIYNKPITKVKKMNILGVTINNQLKLDQNNEEFNKKLINNTSYLHELNKLRIINTQLEWKILIDSLINSLTIVNNFPLLAIDVTGREYMTKIQANAIKAIFNWSPSTTTKAIQFVLNQNLIEDEIEHLIQKRMALIPTYGKSYKILLDILQMQTRGPRNKIFKMKYNHLRHLGTTKNLYNIQNSISQQNIKYAKPNNILNKPFEITISAIGTDIKYKISRTTILILLNNGYNGTMLVELRIGLTNDKNEIIEKSTILHKGTFLHEVNQANYFNELAILNIVTEYTECKNLLIDDRNSLIMALYNMNNHDYRIIKLRQKLIDERWQLCKMVNYNELIELKMFLKCRLKEEMNLPAIKLSKPNITDYMELNIEKKRFEQLDKFRQFSKDDLIRYLIELFKIDLAKDDKNKDNLSYNNPFNMLTPSKISRQQMMMFSGLIKNFETGELNKVYKNMCQLDRICNNKCCLLKQELNYRHTIIHNALECKAYIPIRKMIFNMEKIDRKEMIQLIYNENDKSVNNEIIYKLIKLLALVAFNKMDEIRVDEIEKHPLVIDRDSIFEPMALSPIPSPPDETN